MQLGRLKGGTGEDGDGEEAAPDPDKLVMVKVMYRNGNIKFSECSFIISIIHYSLSNKLRGVC